MIELPESLTISRQATEILTGRKIGGVEKATSPHKFTFLQEHFDENYFEEMIRQVKKDLSAKALLATEQRIPGLGNGVVQDILFNAGIHPKRKISTLTDLEKPGLLYSMKGTLAQMAEAGGSPLYLKK